MWKARNPSWQKWAAKRAEKIVTNESWLNFDVFGASRLILIGEIWSCICGWLLDDRIVELRGDWKLVKGNYMNTYSTIWKFGVLCYEIN